MSLFKLFKTLSVLCIFSLLSACAAVSLKSEHAKNIHRIGVISFLQNDFRVYDFGLTKFERLDHKKLKLPEWDLESLVQNTVKEELDSHSNYTYVPISKGKDIKKEIQDSVSESIVEDVIQHPDLSFATKRKDIASELRHLGEKNKIDTWILVYPIKSTSPILQRSHYYITGVGAIRELSLIGRTAAIFANLRVDVVTANEAEVIAEFSISNSEDISVSLWETANDLPDSSVPDSFVNSVKGMVSMQLRESLAKMKVTR